MICQIAAEVFVALIIIILIKKYNTKKAEDGEAKFELGLIVFFIITIGSYIFLIINYYFIMLTPFYDVIILLTTMVSLIVMVFTIEVSILTKNKFILTIIYIINVIAILILGFVFQFSFLDPPLSLGNIALLFFLPIIYFYIAIRGFGDIRKQSLLMGTGFLLSLIGGGIRPDVLTKLMPEVIAISPLSSYTLGPALNLIGLIILFYALYRME